jgi:AcrR family transcriptional regulator
MGVLPVYLDESDPPSKRAMLVAALRLFVRQGLAETTVRDIAAEAGFSNPVLFKYFAGREELAVFLFSRCYRAFSARLAAALRAPAPFPDKLVALVDVFLASMDEDLDAVVFVQDNLRRMWPLVGNDVKRHSVVSMVRKLLEEGDVDSALDRRLLVVSVLGTFGQLGRAFYFRELPVTKAADLQDAVVQLLGKLLMT